jgi:flagellar basal-body rod modification protein FlgD
MGISTMDIGAVTPNPAPATKDRTSLADNFGNFLKLLTTQLQNQDPTSPMDADQFTQQLVQFSSVEQQIKSNETLTNLLTMMQSDQLSRAVGYLGAEVEAQGETVRLGADGSAKIYYDLGQDADRVTISIRDEFGGLVAVRNGETSQGNHELTWDGLKDDGTRAADGDFQIEIAAEDRAGRTIAADSRISGIVDGVEMLGGKVMLSIDGVLMPLDTVEVIRRAAIAS